MLDGYAKLVPINAPLLMPRPCRCGPHKIHSSLNPTVLIHTAYLY